MPTLEFEAIDVPAPDLDAVRARHRGFEDALQGEASADDLARTVAEWDTLRREIETWEALVNLRFNQDTTDAEAKAAREHKDELSPKLTELDVALKRKLLAHPARPALEERIGGHAFALWEVDVLAFDPVIADDLVAESKLKAHYVELLASAELPFQGETHNLSTIVRYRTDADRAVRHAADRVLWGWMAAHRSELDSIYAELVALRTRMARALSMSDFIELGYKRMARIDYDRADVDRYRAAVREHVVPLAAELCRRQAQRLGLDELMAWDELVQDPTGNPVPQGDHDWLLDRAQEMFDSMGGGLGGFFRTMNAGRFLDLKSRKGKAGGGFCTGFPTHGMPYVFANFNGTKGDVEVFTHEMGHAFQNWSSRDQSLVEYLWPTMESCEIHSMSLEFLTWPHMEKFFGADAERFRRVHLTESLLFLPYGVAVDHFQHEVYERPEATPEERFAMWQEMERTYLPWRRWGDLEHPAAGGRWQLQSHIYRSPFYYIDYTLAQTCALQFWVRAERDREEAMAAYVALCQRGGEAPFQDLARSAGIVSPFDEGCLEEVVSQARRVLEA